TARSRSSSLRPQPHISTLHPYTTLFRSTFGDFGYGALLKQYQAQHPNVTIKTRSYAKLDDYKPKLAQYIATGSGAGDVVALEERSEEHTSELQSRVDIVCRLLLEKKKEA